MRLFLPLALLPAAVIAPATAYADVQVVTDIAPIHSLVAQVMEGVGAPEVLVNGGASPHDFQFNFDQAAAVQNADVVIWAGEGLTPWLEDALDTLSADAVQISLLETEGWPKLELRTLDEFGDHDHGHGHGDKDAHDDQEDHEGHNDHEGHSDDHEDHHEDHHGAHNDHAADPHAWLDPVVAQFWVAEIRDTLVAVDPDNAEIYTVNAATATADLRALSDEIDTMLSTVPAAPYLVPHDAYQYFEARYGHPARAAIALSDASAPTPDQIADLQKVVAETSVVCVLSDPQARAEWGDLVREGTDARTALVDPLGSAIDTGPAHYRQTMLALAAAFKSCLGG